MQHALFLFGGPECPARTVRTVSRLGGDEFIIVLPELHDMADADVITRKMIAIVGTECVVAGQKVRITPSLGISIFPTTDEMAIR